jgi:hypothetical protein
LTGNKAFVIHLLNYKVMKIERLIIFILFLGLIQLAACERSKLNDPSPSSQRGNADSIPITPGDSIQGDSIIPPDTLTGGIDTLPHVDTVRRQPFKEGEEFSITPSIIQDSLAYLRLNVITKNQYNCLNNFIDVAAVNIFGKIDISLREVTIGHGCDPGTAPSKATIYFDRNNISPDSTYQLHIKASGKDYQGTLKKAGAGYEISWPYDSGVTFTKKSF